MNILMTLSQKEVTGAEVYAVTIGNELSRRGHQVIYASDTLSKPILGRFIKLQFNKRSLQRRLWQIVKLIWVIKREKIQLVHAHSRASGWASHIACSLTRTPMVTTVHGRQSVHPSRKLFHAFGYTAIAVAEDIRDQIILDLGVAREKVTVLRNAIDLEIFRPAPLIPFVQPITRPIVSIIGRLTGPKGELCYQLLERILGELATNNQVIIRIVTSSAIPKRFDKFKAWIVPSHPGDDILQSIVESHLIIGAGRVAVEALLVGRPVFAIGEAKSIGLITADTVDHALRSNFGDIGPKELDINFDDVKTEVKQFLELLGATNSEAALEAKISIDAVRSKIAQQYNLRDIVNQLENIYQTAVIDTLKREMPILMYHRFIAHESEKGIHGTWIHEGRFERHLQLIKWLGYETLTFRDLAQKGFIHRLEPGKKFLMITADDGYRDNLTRMLPLLEKYNMSAVIFIVSNETHNRWDTEHSATPDVRADLLSAEEIRALDASGRIEIGGHTLSHARLDELAPPQQREEIVGNKKHLEDLLGHPLLSFAYPYGYLNESAKSEAKAAGYHFAVATDSGPRALHQDPFQIRRIAVFPRTDAFGLWRKIRGNYVWRR